MTNITEDLVKLLGEHADYIPDDDSSGDLCAGCFARLVPDSDSHSGSLAGLRKHQAEVIAAAGWRKGREAAPPEIRYATLDSGDAVLDEVVARGASVHLEAMSDQCWWLGIESGGQMVHVNLSTKRETIAGFAELD